MLVLELRELLNSVPGRTKAADYWLREYERALNEGIKPSVSSYKFLAKTSLKLAM
jgi:hypothetical protein